MPENANASTDPVPLQEGHTIGAAKQCVVILTALGVETEAVLRQLGEWADEDVGGTVFHRGCFGKWDIAVVEVGAGNTRAASVGMRALEHFGPRLALFIGVAGGVKDVKIGDVVVATKVYGYESGKDEERGFKPRPELGESAHAIESRARASAGARTGERGCGRKRRHRPRSTSGQSPPVRRSWPRSRATSPRFSQKTTAMRSR
jgi:hypothetical protein